MAVRGRASTTSYRLGRLFPWLPGSVLVLCDLLTMDGDPVEVSPRQILRRQIERAAERGYVVK